MPPALGDQGSAEAVRVRGGSGWVTAGQVGDRNPRKSRPRSLGLDGPGRTAHLAVCHYMGAATAVRLAARLPATSPAPA